MPGTTKALVPGSPVGLLACRYHGSYQREPYGTLAASATFPPAAIAAALDQPPGPYPGPLVHGCPFGNGEVIVLRFVYADAHILNVAVAAQGCPDASNGDRDVSTPQSVLSTLQATLGRDQPLTRR